MKRMRRKLIWVRLTAIFLSMSLGLCCLSETAGAAEDAEITVATLEALAEPTEFPAEGTMHMNVLRAESLENGYVDTYEEAYLPVIVDQNRVVYAKLSTLAGYLEMNVEASVNASRKQVRTVRYYNSALILMDGSSEAVYTMYASNGIKNLDSFYPYTAFSIGTAPMMYEDEFYVPLDAFLQCTGSFSFYAGKNDMGKQELYITPPQKTVLDDMVYFYREAYSSYLFDMEKDLGYTSEKVNATYYSAEAVQFIKRFGTIFDGAAWSMVFGADDEYFDDKYVDIYMDYVLHANEEVLNESIETAGSVVDLASVLLDVTELSVSKQWEKTTVISNWFLDYNKTELLNRIREGSSNAGVGTLVAGNALNYWSICASLYGADQISVNGAELLMNEYENLMNRQFLSEQDIEQVEKNVNNYGDKLELNAFWHWVEEYWMSNGMSFAKILTEKLPTVNGILGVTGVASSIWSGGTQLLYGKYLDQTENFMAAYFGQQYEYEVMPAAKSSITSYVNGKMSEEDARSIIYHVMAACYTARYFGCLALEDQFEYYPQGKARQQEINQSLVEMMATLQCDSILMGMTQQDYYNLDYNEEIHYDNVYFNVCQVQGSISNWDNGKPADNLEVWISDEAGAVLAEFATDKAGNFDVAFEVEDVSIFEEGNLQKQITFHIDEWWYPEILETVEIQVFRKSQVDGLWAGRKKETISCYLENVHEENGQVILDVRRIAIDEDTDNLINLELPVFFAEGSYSTYILGPGEYEFDDTIERIVLEDGMTFETLFSMMYPDGTWAGELMQLFSGSLESEYAMDALMNSDLHEVDEIWRYIEQYYQINGSYPTYEITKVNSVIDRIDPILIEIYQ